MARARDGGSESKPSLSDSLENLSFSLRPCLSAICLLPPPQLHIDWTGLSSISGFIYSLFLLLFSTWLVKETVLLKRRKAKDPNGGGGGGGGGGEV